MNLTREITKNYKKIAPSATLIVPELQYDYFKDKLIREGSEIAAEYSAEQRGDGHYAIVAHNVKIANLKHVRFAAVQLEHNRKPIRISIRCGEEFEDADVLFDFKKDDTWQGLIKIYKDGQINWSCISVTDIGKVRLFADGLFLASGFVRTL